MDNNAETSNASTSTSTVTQSTAPPNTSSNSKKYLLIALVIIVVGIGAYVLGTSKHTNRVQTTPKQQVTENTSLSPVVTQVTNAFNGKLAFVRDFNVWVKDNGTEKQITTDAKFTRNGIYQNASLSYSYPSISPDGKKVVFFQTKAIDASKGIFQSPTSLYISNVDGSGLKPLITNGDFERIYPVQWFKDGQSILIETYKNHVGDDNTLIKLNINTGSQQILTTYNIHSGCGGGSSDPSSILAGSEGARPVYSKIFQLSADNNYLIHNTACTGYGVNVYNLQANQDKPVSEDITQAIFSPDGTKIAGIGRNNEIMIFDTSSASAVKSLTATEQPQVLYWASDGQTIYYGTDTLVSNLTVKDDLGNQLEGKKNKASIWSILVDGTGNKKLTEFDAYDVKPLFVSADKSTALIAKVDNPTLYFDALSQNGKNMSPNNEPFVNVVKLNLNTGNASNFIHKASQSYYSQ